MRYWIEWSTDILLLFINANAVAFDTEKHDSENWFYFQGQAKLIETLLQHLMISDITHAYIKPWLRVWFEAVMNCNLNWRRYSFGNETLYTGEN